MIKQPNPERLKRMQASPKIFIMDPHGNIVLTNKEIRTMLHELEADEKAKLKAEKLKRVEAFKKRCGR